MSFKVVITQTYEKITHAGGEHGIIAQANDNGVACNKYGIVPVQEVTRTVTEPIYEQTVETLDVTAVINAVNKQPDKAAK